MVSLGVVPALVGVTAGRDGGGLDGVCTARPASASRAASSEEVSRQSSFAGGVIGARAAGGGAEGSTRAGGRAVLGATAGGCHDGRTAGGVERGVASGVGGGAEGGTGGPTRELGGRLTGRLPTGEPTGELSGALSGAPSGTGLLLGGPLERAAEAGSLEGGVTSFRCVTVSIFPPVLLTVSTSSSKRSLDNVRRKRAVSWVESVLEGVAPGKDPEPSFLRRFAMDRRADAT